MLQSTYGKTKNKQAIPFIIKHQTSNRYELTTQAKDLLKNIDRPISVVSVAGLYRTGKSYLLNSVILDKKSVFGVGPTVNPCTKGLWLWIEPDPISQGRDMLVIDTEGLGALDQQSNHDMKIFCLAVLLSTTFIYNSVGSIDENALQTLSLVLNLVSSIDQDSNCSHPQFIWVVRDFSLQLIDDKGNCLTPKQYLQMALHSNNKQKQKAVIRKTITNSFSDRDCFTLVKPLIDENKLQNLDQISMDELRPEFVSQSIELRNKIKSTLKPFKLATNSQIRGKQYLLVVQKYLLAINQGAVPNIVDTWTFIKQEKSREALEQTKKIYTEKINSKIMTKVPMKRSMLEQLFKSIKQEIKNSYYKFAYYQHELQSYKSQGNYPRNEGLQQYLNSAYNHIMRVNEDESQKFIRSMLQKQYEPYNKKLFSHYYAVYQQFENDLKKKYKQEIIQKYSQRVQNIKDYTQKFVDGKLIQNFKMFQRKLKDEIKNLGIIKNQLQQQMETQISRTNETNERDRRVQQDKIFELQKQLKIYQNQQYQYTQASKAEKQLNQNKTNMLKRKNQEYNQQINELQKQISELSKIQVEMKQKIFVQNKQFQKEKALFIQKQEHMQNKIKDLQKKNQTLESKINETGGKFEYEKKGLINEYQKKTQQLETQNKRLIQKSSQAQGKLGKMLDEAKQLYEQIEFLKRNSQSQRKVLEERIIQAESSKKTSPLERQLKQQNQQLHSEMQKLQQKFNEITRKFKQGQDQYKSYQTNTQKQIAIHVQQIQFQQVELKDLKSRYDQLKISHHAALQNLQDNSKSLQNNSQLKIFQLNTEHQNELKNLETQYEQKLKIIKKQLQMVTNSNQELRLQSSLQKKSLENKEKEWKQSHSILESMYKKLQEKLKSSEKDCEDIYREKQTYYIHRLKKLQEQVQQTKEKSYQEIQQNKKKSQEALSVLKHYSQVEKQQWQKRLHDDRQKAQKKLKGTRDEYEKKLQEQKQSYEEEINDYQQKVVHMERIYNERLQNMQYDHDINIQKITNAFMEEKAQKEKRIALLDQEIGMSKSAFERQMNNKIREYENMMNEIKESMKKQYQKSIRNIKQQLENTEQKYDNVKKQNRKLEQNNLILKNQSDKQRTLHREKQRSLQIKIQEVQIRLSNQLTTFNKVIQNINQKNAIERQSLNNQIDKLNRQILSLNQQKNQHQSVFEAQRQKYEKKINYLNQQKQKSKEEYEDMMNKFANAVQKFNKTKQQTKQKKTKELQQLNIDYQRKIDELNSKHQGLMKISQQRIARLVTENRSLKDRLCVLENQKSNFVSAKKNVGSEQMMKKYQQRIDQYKGLLEMQKQTNRKLVDENQILRVNLDTSCLDKSDASSVYYERPSFSQYSNSRVALRPTQPKNNQVPTRVQFTQVKGTSGNNNNLYTNPKTRKDSSVVRVQTNNNGGTPLIHKKSRIVDVQEFSGITKYNGKY